MYGEYRTMKFIKKFINRITAMVPARMKSKGIIMTVVLAALLLTGLTGGCGGGGDSMVLGITNHESITLSDRTDPEDAMLRADVYDLHALAGETYTFVVESLSGVPIQVWECNGRQALILEVFGGGIQSVDWTFDRDGKKEIWFEAYEDVLPADYTFRIALVE